ncbi:retrotransposon protein, putative, ty1-copia subclass [Tanacetum coccineum]
MARKPYSHQVERAQDLLGLIHTDVCGPIKIMSRQGAHYFVTFTDDFSRYGYVYLLKHKNEVFENFKVFQKEVENQLGKTIKSLCSNHGGKYMSQEFLDHLKDHGIITHRTPTYMPQHNSVSKRRNRTLLDMVRSMMSQTTLPKSFWDYALESAARILNMVPTKKVDKTPDEIWHGSFKCIIIGYPKEMMGYSFYNPSENKVFVARNAEFFKSNLIDQEASESLEDLEIIQEEDRHGWQWNKRFDDEIKKFGFTQNRDEPCVYQKASGSYVTFLILYVDDILIMGNNIPMLQDVKSYLGKCFAMKDLGEAAYILGIKIYKDRSKRLIGLCQSAYIEKILKRYYMENSKRRTIPMQDKLKLSKSDGASTPAEMRRMSNVPYASAVGSIMYAVRCTRPDVAFAQNITSRFQQNPGELHWTTVKNILKYLQNTKDMFLVYGGYVFVLNGEAVWIHKFISGLNVVPTIEEPITMYCDNTGAITIANDHGVTKDDNLADPFTKALAFPKHSELTRKIGLIPASSLM